jgi:hypothetical protein
MRRSLSKKAEFSIMVAVIITLAVGLSLLVIGYQMSKKSKDMDDDEKCRLSIFANAQISKARQASSGLMDFPVAFECPRKPLKIDLEDVEKYDRIDDDLFKTVIAEEVKACWSKVGAGKLDPFKASTNVNEHFCLVCTEFYLDSELEEQMRRQRYNMTGFQYWIAGHKLPGLKTSLYEFVQGKRPTPELLESLKASETSPDSMMDFTSQKYVVVWRVEKWEPGRWEGVGMVAGAALLGVLTFGVGTAIVAGAAVGLMVTVTEDNAQISQQVIVIPEERLTERQQPTRAEIEQMARALAGGPTTRRPVFDFCTVMIN